MDFMALPGLPTDVIEFLNAGETAFALVRDAVSSQIKAASCPKRRDLACAGSAAGQDIGLGHNYYDHMGKGRTEPTEYPTFFCKTANTIIARARPSSSRA